MATVVLTSVAARDLARVQDWLLQPGPGRREKKKAQHIVAAIQTLASDAGVHSNDPFRPGNRRLIVEDHVVSYRQVWRAEAEFVFVERIFGPGQQR